MAKRKAKKFDFLPLKVKNLLYLLTCRWCATYFWKALDEGYNFSLDLASMGGLHTKLWASKITRIPGQNDIWVLGLRPSIKNTIRGKVVVSLKFRPW
jgi:hypothetical protein